MLVKRRFAFAVLALVVVCESFVVGCQAEPTVGPRPEEPPPAPPADAVAGRAAFTTVCAACHSSRDGFDLAFFGFPDSTIIRRAVFHVDSATARDIAAHVQTFGAAVASRSTRAFQPQNVVLVGDLEFAVRVFGADAWPETLTTDGLRAIDPLTVAVAVPFPRWSVEFDNVDWMPETPLPNAILDHRGGNPRRALERYYATPSRETLLAAISALRVADRDELAAAPCARVGGMGPVADGAACFEVRRWVATLAAQYMLRNGAAGPVHAALHDTWWDVGNAVRLSDPRSDEIPNRDANWASWMYLGWAFDPGRHASVYTGNGLTRTGLERHATFVALRSQVARSRGSEAVFADAASSARFAPDHWAYASTRFAFGHLLERLAAGERPMRAEELEGARAHVESAYDAAARKVTAAEQDDLAALRDQVLAALASN